MRIRAVAIPKRDINAPQAVRIMPERTIPVCCTEEQHRAITEHAKRRGMTNASQLIEELLD